MRVRPLVLLSTPVAQLSASLTLVVGFIVGLSNCGDTKVVDDNSDAGLVTCDSSKCAPDNTCIEYEGVTECRLTCDAQRGATGCPQNYSCIQHGSATFCKADRWSYEPAPGQWGTPCAAQEGLNASQCDSANGFRCLYNEPNDPNAICTAWCETDEDCTGGFYCGDANDIPASARTRRTVGAVNRLCLPRSYCAPCENDVDCAPAPNGTKQYCVSDKNGAGICAPTCDSDGACNDEAFCANFGDKNLCYPIAEVCVGDGTFCSPCRSDSDCKDGGACVDSAYTTERNCSVPSKVKCQAQANPPKFDCPKAMPAGTAKNSFPYCPGEFFKEAPRDHCTGLIELSKDGQAIGCYARGGRR